MEQIINICSKWLPSAEMSKCFPHRLSVPTRQHLSRLIKAVFHCILGGRILRSQGYDTPVKVLGPTPADPWTLFVSVHSHWHNRNMLSCCCADCWKLLFANNAIQSGSLRATHLVIPFHRTQWTLAPSGTLI